MAQSRLRDYKDPILSFEHNLFNLGLHNPGRYCGFDLAIMQANPLQFKLNHGGTGFFYRDQSLTPRGRCGVLMTPQGTLIMEDADTPIMTIETNIGNAEVRYDLVVLTHIYNEVDGGADGVYSVIKGPVNNPILPVLADPLTQVAIGTLVIPAGANSIANMKFIPSKCPDSGDGEDARLTYPNMFQFYQGLKRAENFGTVTDNHTSGSHIASLYSLENDGNQWQMAANDNGNYVDGIVIKDIPLQFGMRVNLVVDNGQIFRESRYFEEEANLWAKGYRGFIINPGLTNFTIPVSARGGGSQFGIKNVPGEKWEIEAVYIPGAPARWLIVSIGGAGATSQIPRGMYIPWSGDVANNFDATGKGINLMAGFHIANGNLGTVDLRGKVLSVASNVPSAGQPLITEAQVIADGGDPDDYIFLNPLQSDGKKRVTLGISNLPSYNLPVTDPGHTHFTMSSTGGGGLVNGTNRASREAGLGGNSSYSIQGTGGSANVALSSNATTNITVFSGGAGVPVEVVMPVVALVWVMKL